MSTELALFAHAKEALAAAVRFDEVQSIRSRARQAEAYGKIARDKGLIADANEVIARAERKLGIMLRAAKDDGLLSQGGRPENSNLREPETGADAEPVFDNTPFTLADIGVDKKLSSRAQKLAELAEDEFEEVVADKREKILATDAVPAKPKTVSPSPTPKPEPIKPLEPRRFHQFVVSLLALSFASDRVTSVGIWDLARTTGIVIGDNEDMEFTPEAYEAIGALIETALPALLARNTPEGSGTAREASGGQPLPGMESLGSGPGQPQGDIGGLQHGTQSAPQPLSTSEADAIILAAYEANTSGAPIVALLAAQIGRPGQAGKAYVRNRARVMGLSSRDNQRAAASAFATAQNAARREGQP